MTGRLCRVCRKGRATDCLAEWAQAVPVTAWSKPDWNLPFVMKIDPTMEIFGWTKGWWAIYLFYLSQFWRSGKRPPAQFPWIFHIWVGLVMFSVSLPKPKPNQIGLLVLAGKPSLTEPKPGSRILTRALFGTWSVPYVLGTAAESLKQGPQAYRWRYIGKDGRYIGVFRCIIHQYS